MWMKNSVDPDQLFSKEGCVYSVLISSKPSEGTLIFSYIPRLRPFFLVQNFKFQYVLEHSEK